MGKIMWKWHVAFWSFAAGFLWVYVMLVVPDQFSGSLDILLLLLAQLAAMWLTAWWSVPRAFRQTKHPMKWLIVYLLLQSLLIIGALMVVSVIAGAMQVGEIEGDDGFFIDNIWEVVLLLVPGILAGFIYYAVRWGWEHWIARKLVERQLSRKKREIDELEQVWLQFDLAPHLLFNSLTMIKYLTRHEPESAIQAMATLIALMKFYVEHRNEPLIALADEVTQVHNIVRLYEYRLGAPIALQLRLPKQLEAIRIIPMSLLLLAENMCKYGVATDASRPLCLTVQYEAGKVDVVACNRISPAKLEEVESLGIGLENLRRRLALHYEKRQGFDMVVREDTFIVNLFFYLSGS